MITLRKEVITMPGFDGTGPMGLGSRTGGRRGFCSPGRDPAPYSGYPYRGSPYGGYSHRGYPYGCGFGVGRGGIPRGGGKGRTFGGGRGHRWW